MTLPARVNPYRAGVDSGVGVGVDTGEPESESESESESPGNSSTPQPCRSLRLNSSSVMALEGFNIGVHLAINNVKKLNYIICG